MKKGFTLAEVLITLSIIGVVSAMTMPALYSSVQKSQAGPAFMKAMNVLEQANMLVMHENNARNILRACDANNNNKLESQEYINCIAPVLNGRSVNSTEAEYYYDQTSYPFGNSLVLKDGTTYGRFNRSWFKKNAGWNDYNGGNFEKVYYTTLWVDINGTTKGPNLESRDVFSLFINEDTGKVFAMGSDSFVGDLNSRSSYSDWGTQGIGYGWRKGCNKDKISNAGTCGGSIVDNGGKIIYPWK